MAVVTCPFCSFPAALPDPWLAPGYTCPNCGAVVSLNTPPSPPSRPRAEPVPSRELPDSRATGRDRPRRPGRLRAAGTGAPGCFGPVTIGCGVAFAALLLFCAVGMFVGWRNEEGAKKELAEANRLWDAGKRAEAAVKYKDLLERGWRNVPGTAERPVVYQRVIESEVERGNGNDARAWAEKALDNKLEVKSIHPPVTQLLAQVQADRERRAAEEQAKREAEAQREREEREARAKRREEEREAEARRQRDEDAARAKRAETEQDADGLVLLKPSVKANSTPLGGEIAGTVVNRTGRKLTYAQITFNLYDRSGAQVGTALANINGLEPDGRWNFKAHSFGTNFDSFKFSELTGY